MHAVSLLAVKHTFKQEIPDELCEPHFPRTARMGHFSFCP